MQALLLVALGSALPLTSETDSNNHLLSSIDLSEIFAENSTSKVKESVREVASNYVINGTDIKKRFFNKGKKYRILKVVKKTPLGYILKNNDTKAEDIIRNIKLEVDSKGNMKVPNLFKIKRRKKYPNYVRKHRQIYREDLRNFHKSEKDAEESHKPPVLVIPSDASASATSGPRPTRDESVTSHSLPPLVHVDSAVHHAAHVPHLHVVTPTLVHVTTSPLEEKRHIVTPSPPHNGKRIVTPSGYHYTTKSSFVDVKFGKKTYLQSTAKPLVASHHLTSNAPIVPYNAVTSAPMRDQYPGQVFKLDQSKESASTNIVARPHATHQSASHPSVPPQNFVTQTPISPHQSTSHILHGPKRKIPQSSTLSASIESYLIPSATPKLQQSTREFQRMPLVSKLSTKRPFEYSSTASNFYPTPKPFESSTFHSKILLGIKESRPGLPLVQGHHPSVSVINTNSKTPKTSTTITPALYDPKEEFILSTTTVNPITSSSPSINLSTSVHSKLDFEQKVAVGSKHHIDNLFNELEQGSPLISLYDENRKIKLVGPIAVRATGPQTFTIVDPGDLEAHKPIRGQPPGHEIKLDQSEGHKTVKRDYLHSPNLIQEEKQKTTKRPSLHFEPLKSKNVVSTPGKSVTKVTKYIDENRRWPKSKPNKRGLKPIPRIDNGVDPRHSKQVRFEDLSNDPKASSTFVRFPS